MCHTNFKCLVFYLLIYIFLLTAVQSLILVDESSCYFLKRGIQFCTVLFRMSWKSRPVSLTRVERWDKEMMWMIWAVGAFWVSVMMMQSGFYGAGRPINFDAMWVFLMNLFLSPTESPVGILIYGNITLVCLAEVAWCLSFCVQVKIAYVYHLRCIRALHSDSGHLVK